MGKDIEGFREMLKEKGYDVKEAIEVLSVDGVDYILEGHHRNFAAALNHMTLVPYKIVAKDDEKMPGAINTARQYAYAYIEDQREYLSRYVYDHEEFFRKIKDEKGQEIEPNFTYAEVYGGKYPSIPKKSREDDGQER